MKRTAEKVPEKGTEQIGVNLPLEVAAVFHETRGGLPSTRFVIAGMIAYLALTPEAQSPIAAYAGQLVEGKISWPEVRQWLDAFARHRQEIMTKAAGAEFGKDDTPASKRRERHPA